MGSVAANLASVRESVARASDRAGRPGSVRLVAVSKGHSSEAIREAFQAGQRDFGENYAQELAEKAVDLADLGDLAWHFTGHLQRNKVKEVLRMVSVIHTVEREELAAEIEKRSSGAIGVFLEVNVGREAQKSGCEPEMVPALAKTMHAMEHVRLLGLMTVPPMHEEPEASRPFFVELRVLAERLADAGLVRAPLELSMGMSHDFAVAIEEGATIVRVGTSIFGHRCAGDP